VVTRANDLVFVDSSTFVNGIIISSNADIYLGQYKSTQSVYASTLGTAINYDTQTSTIYATDSINLDSSGSRVLSVSSETDGGGNYYIYARVGTVSGNAISYAASTQVSTQFANPYNYVSVSSMGADKFVVGYFDPSLSSLQVRICTVSNNTITCGTVSSAYASGASYPSVVGLDSTYFAVAYYDNAAAKGYVRVGQTSGTTVSSYGTAQIFSAGIPSYIEAEALSSTKLVIAYQDASASGLNTVVVDTSGTTATPGSRQLHILLLMRFLQHPSSWRTKTLPITVTLWSPSAQYQVLLSPMDRSMFLAPQL
jgi:hypothetical protein